MRIAKITLLVASVLAFLVLPQPAAACGYGCIYPDGCGTCAYLGGSGSGSCVQYDTCVCIDIQCGFALPEKEGEIGLLEELELELGLEPEATQSVECPDPAGQVWRL